MTATYYNHTLISNTLNVSSVEDKIQYNFEIVIICGVIPITIHCPQQRLNLRNKKTKNKERQITEIVQRINMDSRLHRNNVQRGHVLGDIAAPQQHTGAIYTMSGKGSHILMNSQSIITATNVQFVPPVRAKSTSATTTTTTTSTTTNMMADKPLPVAALNPVLNTIRGLFSLLFWPITRPQQPTKDLTVNNKQTLAAAAVDAHTNSSIYMNFMSDLTSFSFFDFDEYADDRLDSPIDMKKFDFGQKTVTSDDDSPKKCTLNAKLKASVCEIMSPCTPSVDTIDYVCNFAVPKCALIEEWPMPQNVVIVADKFGDCCPCDVVTDRLSPAAGLRLEATVFEDNTCIANAVPKFNHKNHANRVNSDRKAARKNRGQRNNRHVSKKATQTGKNRTSKSRHELELAIQDDLHDMHWSVDEHDDDDVPVNGDEIVSAPGEMSSGLSALSLCVSLPSPSPPPMIVVEETRPGCIFSRYFSFGPCVSRRVTCRPWPMPAPKSMQHPAKANTAPVQRQRHSEPESEDNFIMLAEDSPRTLPSIITAMQNGRSLTVPNCIVPMAVTRQRGWSESSDDFICFENDGNTNDDDDVFDDYDDTDDDSEASSEESDTDTDSEDDVDGEDSESDIDDEYLSTGTNPPDSGIEEKKVCVFGLFGIFSYLCSIESICLIYLIYASRTVVFFGWPNRESNPEAINRRKIQILTGLILHYYTKLVLHLHCTTKQKNSLDSHTTLKNVCSLVRHLII